MILTKPSYQILSISGSPHTIESYGRTCYKSEDKITSDSAEAFIKMIKKRGHLSVIEHSSLSVRFIIDRGVSHELVRHRLCAFSQESTRYCDYKGGVEFIIPPWVDVKEGEYLRWTGGKGTSSIWAITILNAERSYKVLRANGWSPQQARSVLPNSLKTEIVVTANFREWLHILSLRCSKSAHPQMREIMIPLREELNKIYPSIFTLEEV